MTNTSSFTITLNDAFHHAVPDLEGHGSDTTGAPSYQPVLLSPQLPGAGVNDEEVRSKPHILPHDQTTSFERSYSSEASTPNKSPSQFSSSPFSASKDYSSPTSYGESLYPIIPLNDKPLLQATTTTATTTTTTKGHCGTV